MKICAAFGGLSKYQQIKELKAGVDVAVCTPGRMIDLIRSKACTMKRVTYVVCVILMMCLSSDLYVLFMYQYSTCCFL